MTISNAILITIIALMSPITLYVIALYFGIDLLVLIKTRGKHGNLNIAQQFTNDRGGRTCAFKECRKIINIGEMMIKKINMNPIFNTDYYHKEC